MTKLLSIGNDPKTIKGERVGVRTAIQYLSASDSSGLANLCAHASYNCKRECIQHTGHMKFNAAAREYRTRLFVRDRANYWALLLDEIVDHMRASHRAGLVPAIRLNGTSDIPWERVPVRCGPIESPNFFTFIYHELIGKLANGELAHNERLPLFYDYTAYPYDARPTNALPVGYTLTFSRKETTSDREVLENLERGRNVAVVFKNGLPSEYLGYPVIDGDVNDCRFFDEWPCIVGLKAKGPARNDASGFVVDTAKLS
jgi:hypothetical protein